MRQNHKDHGYLSALDKRIESFPETIQAYIHWLKINATERTVESYVTNLKSLESRFKKNLLDVTPEEFANFNLHIHKELDRGEIRSTSLHAWITTLRSMYHFAQQEGAIQKSPIPAGYKVKVEEREVACFLRPEHFTAIFRILDEDVAIERRNESLYAKTGAGRMREVLMRSLALQLLIDTGCRTKELLWLKAEDIFPTVIPTEDGGKEQVLMCRIRNAKIKRRALGTRTNPISSETFAVYQDYLKVAHPKVQAGEWLLVQVTARTVRNWIYAMKDRLVAAGYPEVEKLSAHDFRRVFITALQEQGYDSGTIQTFSGHVNANMIARYSRLGVQRRQDVHAQTFGKWRTKKGTQEQPEQGA